MSTSQTERIQANCQIIWGKGDYDITIESEDDTFWAEVKNYEITHEYGPTLTMTGVCNLPEHALDELDRMLSVWARQDQSGQPMTREDTLAIFGGPRRENEPILKMFMAEQDRRAKEVEGRQSSG